MNIQDIEHIVKEHAPSLYRYAMMLAHQQDTAEELVQISLIKLWQKQEQIRDEQAIRAWLRSVCLNEYRMMMRKNRTLPEEDYFSIEDLELQGRMVSEERTDIMDELQAEEDVRILREGCFHAMANKLTLPQRTAFSLIDMFGLSIKEASQLMELSEFALKGLLYRARMNLESFYAHHCPYISKHGTCHCMPWKEFLMERARTQKQVKMAFSALEFQELHYQSQEEIRKKLLVYYQHMPSYLPSKQWYEKMITLLKTS